MLFVYLFLYVFSLSIPVFYHSAFLVGFAASIHLLLKKKTDFFVLSAYQFSYFCFFLAGYFLVYTVIVLHGTYDFTFFKTYTNSFLSALCAVPLVKIYQVTYSHQSVQVLLRQIVKIFLLQSAIIILVITFPVLKPMVSYFHRDAEYAEYADTFSGGVRTNALSGGLFFGLSLCFGFALLCDLYQKIACGDKNSIKSMSGFALVNIGLMCTGRFGFIYVISALCLFFSSRFFSRTRRLLSFVFFIFLIVLIFYATYHTVGFIKESFDSKISPYFFEFLRVYSETGTVETASTNELADMYHVNMYLSTWLWGDGFYTGNDGLYYKHSDVGYIRIILLGGVPLLIFIMLFFLYSIRPLRRLQSSGRQFYWATAMLFFVAQLKGEIMITSVAINNLIFLLCSLIMLTHRQPKNSK